MLRAVEVLPGKLADTYDDPLIAKALFYPPGIETEGVAAGHAAGACQQAEVLAEIAACLPDGGCVEICCMPMNERSEIEVYRSSESIPTGESFRLLALDIPEMVGDVLKVKFRASLLQARAFSTPVSQQMSLGIWSELVTVRPAQRLFVLRLGSGVQRRHPKHGSQ